MGPPMLEVGGQDRRYVTVTRAGLRRLREERDALLRLWEGVEPRLEKGR